MTNIADIDNTSTKNHWPVLITIPRFETMIKSIEANICQYTFCQFEGPGISVHAEPYI